MLPPQILALSKSFAKFAKLDPFRNMDHDIEEAIDHISNFFELRDGKDLMLIPSDWLNIDRVDQLPVEDLWEYDDVDSWLDVGEGELKHKSTNDRIKFLKLLRGDHSVSWLKDGISAIVLVDFVGNRFVGDGRGRINFAVGMDFKTVPAVILTLKPEFEDQIKLKE